MAKDEGEKKKLRAEMLCHRCQATFTFEAGIAQRPETRGGAVGVTEHGILCPNPACKNWTHAYWISIPLEQQRRKLAVLRMAVTRPNRTQQDLIRFNSGRTKYQKAYGKFQDEMYEKTGTKPTMVREHIVE